MAFISYLYISTLPGYTLEKDDLFPSAAACAILGIGCFGYFVHPFIKTAFGKRNDRRQTGSKG